MGKATFGEHVFQIKQDEGGWFWEKSTGEVSCEYFLTEREAIKDAEAFALEQDIENGFLVESEPLEVIDPDFDMI